MYFHSAKRLILCAHVFDFLSCLPPFIGTCGASLNFLRRNNWVTRRYYPTTMLNSIIDLNMPFPTMCRRKWEGNDGSEKERENGENGTSRERPQGRRGTVTFSLYFHNWNRWILMPAGEVLRSFLAKGATISVKWKWGNYKSNWVNCE